MSKPINTDKHHYKYIGNAREWLLYFFLVLGVLGSIPLKTMKHPSTLLERFLINYIYTALMCPTMLMHSENTHTRKLKWSKWVTTPGKVLRLHYEILCRLHWPLIVWEHYGCSFIFIHLCFKIHPLWITQYKTHEQYNKNIRDKELH